MFIEFKNGSKIEIYESSDTARGYRSQIIGSVCNQCNQYKELKYSEWFLLLDTHSICNTCWEDILKENNIEMNNKPRCYESNNDPYPLCKGKDNCKNCNLHENMEENNNE